MCLSVGLSVCSYVCLFVCSICVYVVICVYLSEMGVCERYEYISTSFEVCFIHLCSFV